MEIDFGFYGPLPGPFQSVPRAELYALLKFLLLTDGETILYTDNKAVYDGINGSMLREPEGPNSDLWAAISKRMENRSGVVRVEKS